MVHNPQKIVFWEHHRPSRATKRYVWWGLLGGAAAGVLLGYPLFIIVYNIREYLYHLAPLVLRRAIVQSFSLHAWPIILLYALSSAIFGGVLGLVYKLLKESQLTQELLQKDFEFQVAGLRHHYKNLAVGIQGFSNRITKKIKELNNQLLSDACMQRECPEYSAHEQEFQHLEKDVAILDAAADDLSQTLQKELEFLKAATSSSLALAPQDLYPVMAASIHRLLELRFWGKDIQVQINGQPWEQCRDSLVFPFEPYAVEIVLENILSNAMKYGDFIQVRVADQGDQVQIAVEDNGPGLEASKLKDLLGASYCPREAGSSHLGLDVSLHLLGRWNGRIGVASEPGPGATFFIVLPK
jgi:signal transduction histidine kinase